MKNIKRQPTHEIPDSESDYSPQILPLPLYRKHIQHSRIAQKEAILRDYKFFSKISAVGESTKETLKTISRCNTARMIYSFQFDPYLCEKSCLKDLCQGFKKIRCLRDLNVVFRRFSRKKGNNLSEKLIRLDKVNESDVIKPYVKKQTRLKKFRFEFPKTNNINDKGIINIGRILEKSISIKSLEEVIIDLENVSDYAYQYLTKSGHKIIHLEEFKLITHKLAKLNTQGIGYIPPKTSIHTKNRLKKAFMSIGGSAGWFSFNPEMSGDDSIFDSKDVIILSNLEHLTSIFSGVFAINEPLSMFDVTFPFMTKLTYYLIEFLNCKISDLEIITLCKILSKAPQIKQFTLKVFQHPNISKDCIHFLVKTLLQFPNLKKFDVYLRRLDLSDQEIHELLLIFSTIKGLKCICFKNISLHISFS